MADKRAWRKVCGSCSEMKWKEMEIWIGVNDMVQTWLVGREVKMRCHLMFKWRILIECVKREGAMNLRGK